MSISVAPHSFGVDYEGEMVKIIKKNTSVPVRELSAGKVKV